MITNVAEKKKEKIKLLTRPQAADRLGLQVQTLASWAMDGRHLAVVKVGRSVRYKESDVDAFIEKSTVGTTS